MQVKVSNQNCSVKISQPNPLTKAKTPYNANNTVNFTSLPINIGMDYNVQVPQTYSKIGIEKLSNGQEIHCYKLGNGQKVMIAPMKTPKTYINTYVNTGATNEKDSERGISHFLEHMAFNGTYGSNGYMKLGIGDVFRKVAEMGGSTNACTGMAETNYTIGIPQFEKEDLETAIKIQSAMMNNLELPENMVEKEHGPVCSEINMYSDDMNVKANNIAFKNLYNISSSSEDLVAGRVDNIKSINRQKVSDYYKNNYYPANMTTVITGDVTPDEAIKLVAKHFRGENNNASDRKYEKLTPVNKTIRQDIISDKAKQTYSTIAFNGPSNNDLKGQLALDVAFEILFNKSNSRISSPLKIIDAEVEPSQQKVSTIPSDGIGISFDIKTTELNSEKSLKTVFTELQNFKINDVSELEQIKERIKSYSQDKFENPERLNIMLGSGSLSYNISDIANQDNILDSLTIDDVESAVKTYLNPSKASIAVVHPATENADSLKQKYINANSTALSFKGGIKNPERLPIDTSKIKNYTQENNYNISFYDTPTNSNAAVEFILRPKQPIQSKPGTEILLTRLLKNKTANKDTNCFENYLDKYNIAQNIDVMNGGTINIKGKMPAKNIQQFINITQEQLMMPFFDEETLKKQKEIVKEILTHAEPDVYEGIDKIMYSNSSFGHTPQDVLENIDSITLDDIKNLYFQIMNNCTANVAVCAPLNNNIKNSVLSSFSRMPKVLNRTYDKYELYKPLDKSYVLTQTVPNAQADIVQSYNFKESGNLKDETTFSLMNGILNNGDETGLFNNLREKEKLAYAVHSSYGKDGNNSFIQCHILTTTDNKDIGEESFDNVQKSINGFNRQINKMKNGEFTDKELETAKKEMKNELLTHSYGQNSMVNMLSTLQNSPYGVNYINDKFKAIDSITKEDIQKAALYAFSGNPIYSIVASEDTLKANKKFLESLVS